ncbi:MAG: hypothetical protein JXQ72_12875 [Anaerolineae bacterium]|nr:hypothetical protein [Anaerolineae bacterium]
MPNGGPTPDCMHCQSFRGDPGITGSWSCHYHQMPLAWPIRAFCAHYVRGLADGQEEPDPEDELDILFAQTQWRDDIMYVWLERPISDSEKNNEPHFFPKPLAAILEYRSWTREHFLEKVAVLYDQYRADE